MPWAPSAQPISAAIGSIATDRHMRSILHSIIANADGTTVFKYVDRGVSGTCVASARGGRTSGR